jgi:hypothetical protein
MGVAMERSGVLNLCIVGLIAAAVDLVLYRRAAHRDAPVAPHWGVPKRDRADAMTRTDSRG